MEYFLAAVPDMAPSGAADSANAAEWLAHLTAQARHAAWPPWAHAVTEGLDSFCMCMLLLTITHCTRSGNFFSS